jgi:putative protease
MKTSPELIMPAGTLEKLRFACAYGADAVYAGMPQFSLRARTNNFTMAQLAEGIHYAHERGVKVFLTVNIFARNSRIESALQALRALMRVEPDAVILSDPGLIMLIRQEFPDLELHLSTQANTMNWAAVQFWQEQGIQRIILPRELSLHEIATIHERVPAMQLEAFVHGAMCISYSGRCLLSSYMAHRNANLGVCTNSCRWQYHVLQKNSEYALEEAERPGEFFPIEEDAQGTYLLNSKDLCAIEYLQELWKAGVSGFKIEGRTKSVYYLSHIGRAYRNAIDTMITGQPFDPAVFQDVYATASRGLMPGFLIDLPEDRRQNYERGYSQYAQYAFAGIVRNYRKQVHLVEVEVKNRMAVGDMIEFISPGNAFCQEIRAMYDLANNPLSLSHGGGQNVLLATEGEVAPFTILRRPLQKKENMP